MKTKKTQAEKAARKAEAIAVGERLTMAEQWNGNTKPIGQSELNKLLAEKPDKTFDELTAGHSDVLKYFKEFKDAYDRSKDPTADPAVAKAYRFLEQAVTLISYDLGLRVRRH